MKSSVAIRLMTLNASSYTSLLADATTEFPSCWWNIVNTVNRLQEHSVCESNLWYPKATDDMSPAAVIGLLESSTSVGAKAAFDRSGGALKASPTKPLAFWNVWHSIAFLMNSLKLLK